MELQSTVVKRRIKRPVCEELPEPSTLEMVQFSGQESQPPPPSPQPMGAINNDQQRSVPVSLPARSVTRRVQVPLTFVPVLPLKEDRGCSGRNVPKKGG